MEPVLALIIAFALTAMRGGLGFFSAIVVTAVLWVAFDLDLFGLAFFAVLSVAAAVLSNADNQAQEKES